MLPAIRLHPACFPAWNVCTRDKSDLDAEVAEDPEFNAESAENTQSAQRNVRNERVERHETVAHDGEVGDALTPTSSATSLFPSAPSAFTSGSASATSAFKSLVFACS